MKVFLTSMIIVMFAAGYDPSDVDSVQSAQAASPALTGVFNEVEKKLISDYYRSKTSTQRDGRSDRGHGKASKGKGKGRGLPPGLAKREQLPPGLQMQLEKNGTLPPGLAKRDLPSDLRGRMPGRDSRYDTFEIDNDVVLVERATGVIVDILADVILGRH